MFDICNCSCFDKGISRLNCRYEIRIPVLEWDSFVGQKRRINKLGSLDKCITAARKRTVDREEALERRKICLLAPSSTSDTTFGDIVDDSVKSDMCNDTYYFPNNELRDNQKNRFTYENLAITADRYRVNSRAAAAIVNAALKDMGILDQCNMLGKKKVERERKRIGEQNTLKIK